MLPRALFFNSLGRYARNQASFLPNRFASTTAPTEELIEDDGGKMAAFEAKRNKSRLSPRHFKILHNQVPVDLQDPYDIYETTVKFRRKIAGKYGGGVGVNLGIAWPTNEDLKQIKEYEKIANPFTLQEMVENKRKIREDERQGVQKRMADIETKTGKLAGWMKELKNRNEKKLAAVREAQEKKDRLVEEVRQHFGYVVSIKDPKFQEMLEKKEKEAKKADKEAKRQVRIEKVTGKAKVESAATSKPKDD